MAAPIRITGPLLDVLDVLLHVSQERQDIHGWAIMKMVKHSAPTVYGILDRLEDAEWINGKWEESLVEGRPRRRLYRLTPTGYLEANNILTARRPSKRSMAVPDLGGAR